MPSVEERVAYLEGRLEDHAGAVGNLQHDVRDLRGQIASLDQKVDRLFHNLDSKVSRQFVWLAGIQVAVLLAVVGALVRS